MRRPSQLLKESLQLDELYRTCIILLEMVIRIRRSAGLLRVVFLSPDAFIGIERAFNNISLT